MPNRYEEAAACCESILDCSAQPERHDVEMLELAATLCRTAAAAQGGYRTWKNTDAYYDCGDATGLLEKAQYDAFLAGALSRESEAEELKAKVLELSEGWAMSGIASQIVAACNERDEASAELATAQAELDSYKKVGGAASQVIQSQLQEIAALKAELIKAEERTKDYQQQYIAKCEDCIAATADLRELALELEKTLDILRMASDYTDFNLLNARDVSQGKKMFNHLRNRPESVTAILARLREEEGATT